MIIQYTVYLPKYGTRIYVRLIYPLEKVERRVSIVNSLH